MMIFKKSNLFLSFIAVTAFVGLTGCVKLERGMIKGNEKMTTLEKAISGNIETLHIKDVDFAIYIDNTKDENISYDIDENLVKHLDISQEGTKLIISSKEDKNLHSKKSKIQISDKNLKVIKTEGLANIKSLNTIKSDKIDFDIEGLIASDFSVEAEEVNVKIKDMAEFTLSSGSSEKLNIDINGVAEFNSKNFMAKDVIVNSSGGSAVNVYAEKTLDVKSDGINDIKYWGDPVLTKDSNGLLNIEKGK